MGTYNTFLISISTGEYLLKVALRVNSSFFKSPDVWQYPMEPENKEVFMRLLPSHCRSAGSIVEIEPIFELVDLKDIEPADKPQ
jgi:hypothetical protein